MIDEVFLDTAYAIVLSSAKDEYHERAIVLAQKLEQAKTRLITTRAIQLEIGNALSKLQYRDAAIQLLDSLEVDPNVEVISMSESLYAKALQLFRERRDKEWGLVDCASFVVMSERNISEALTADNHFQQAGFQVLLRSKT